MVAQTMVMYTVSASIFWMKNWSISRCVGSKRRNRKYVRDEDPLPIIVNCNFHSEIPDSSKVLRDFRGVLHQQPFRDVDGQT